MIRWLVASAIGLSLLALNPALAASGEITENSVVKVYSGLCDASPRLFRGSGTLFRHKGSVYVLTSEHVVLHGNGNYCHEITNHALGSQPAAFVAADWGKGLALLRLKGAVREALPTLDSLGPSELIDRLEGERVAVAGYPFQGEVRVWDRQGRILLVASERHLMADIDAVMELIDSHGEFGMSGGPAMTVDSKHFLGVLSHQYLELRPGRASRVMTFDSATQRAQNHLLVIPSSIALDWTRSILEKTSPATPPRLLVLPQDQIAGVRAVYTAGLRFEFIAQPWDPALSAGIGGADGTGIGGADGTGIGGTVQAPQGEPGTVRVSLSSLGDQARTWPVDRDPFLSRLRTRLLRRNEVEIPYFLKRKSEGENPARLTIHSLGGFFYAFQRKLGTPVIVAKGGIDPDQQYLGPILMSLGQELLALSTLLEKKIGSAALASPGVHPASSLLQNVRVTAELLISANWDLIDQQALRRVTRPEAGGSGETDLAWQYLFGEHFDHAVKLLENLLKAQKSLRKL